MALANSNGYTATSSQREESHSVINFKTGYSNSIHGSGSLLIFDQNDQIPQKQQQHGYKMWEDTYDPIQNYQNQLDPTCAASSSRLLQELDSVDQCGNAFGWPDSEEANAISTSGANCELGTQEACLNKRPHTADCDEIHNLRHSRPKVPKLGATEIALAFLNTMIESALKGESMQTLKKQCSSKGTSTKNPKPKPTHQSKDPQSIAAKNRRERITERLKILQELVPNGSKVDLVTMLEKAISYVKFLQLQVKVLATDEFWPVREGKAPDISQVKEAIDSILSSRKDRNSSSD